MRGEPIHNGSHVLQVRYGRITMHGYMQVRHSDACVNTERFAVGTRPTEPLAHFSFCHTETPGD
jgi:hypothetical protein